MTVVSNFTLGLVVAVEKNNGIGMNGQLPWRLKGDMAFFKKLTSFSENRSMKNAVIMGRKTWESIPIQFKPLNDRINIVLSRSFDYQRNVPENVIVQTSLNNALSYVRSNNIQRVFVIGGSAVYQEAVESSACDELYITRIDSEFECDTYFPEISHDKYRELDMEEMDELIPWAKPFSREENGCSFKFTVYKRR